MHHFGVSVVYGVLATLATLGVLVTLGPERTTTRNAEMAMGATFVAACAIGIIVLLAVADA